MEASRVALIIPTAGRPVDLARCLSSIDNEADERLRELILVDDAPQQPALAPPKVADARIRLLRNPRPIGAARSRNRAIAHLGPTIEAVGFLDDDVILEPGWWTTALHALKRECAAITGPVRRFDDGLVARARQLRYDQRYAGLTDGEPVAFLAGGNSLIWRSALVSAGGFPCTPTMSDTMLAHRLAEQEASCLFIADLRVRHRHSKGAGVAVRESWRAGRLHPKHACAHALPRLLRGIVDAPRTADPAAATLNVALDTVHVVGGLLARRQRAERTAPD